MSFEFTLSENHGCFQYRIPKPGGEGKPEIGARVFVEGSGYGVISAVHKKHLFEVQMPIKTLYLWRLEFVVPKENSSTPKG